MLQHILRKIPLQLTKRLNNYSIFTKHVVKPPNVSINRFISFNFFKRKISPEKLRMSDKIPKEYELIYRCTMSSYLYSAQLVSMSGLIGMAVMLGITYDQHNQFIFDKETVDYTNLTNEEYQLGIFMAGFIILNLGVLVLVTKFPIRIYFNRNTKTYLSVVHGKIPSTKDVYKFKVGEVKYQNKGGVLPWNQYKYTVNNQKTIVLLEQYFRRPQDMNIMLGYSKL